MSKYDQALHHEIFVNKEYAFLDNFTKDSKIIYDIGGHIWFFSLYCFGLNPSLKIHFFEPIPELFDKAKINLAQHKDKIVFNNSWILDRSWVFEIFFNEEKTMQTSIFNNNFLNKNGTSRKCNFINLEKYFKDQKLDTIDILKMDIEWAEFQVLENLSQEIFSKIKVLVFEYHILHKSHEERLNKLKQKLIQIYNNFEQIESKYTDKMGYFIFS